MTCLSPGEKRYLQIASELLRDGPVLIAYDLFDSLDLNQVRQIALLLQKERNQKKGILLLSQRLCTLLGTADQIFFLRDNSLQPYIAS